MNTPLPGEPHALYRVLGEHDVFAARQAVARAMAGLGAREIERDRLVTAASEIFRNAIVHAQGAQVRIHVDRAARQVWVECRDDGPGIADLAQAFTDGWSSGRGMGRGLGGARRLATTFEIESVVGQGTCVRFSGACRAPSSRAPA